LPGNNIFESANKFMSSIKSYYRILLLFFSVILSACESKKSHSGEIENTDLLSQRSAFSVSPVIGARPLGDSILFNVEKVDSVASFDSIIAKVDGIRTGIMTNNRQTFVWNSIGAVLGTHNFRIIGFKQGKEESAFSQTFYICSGFKPGSYRYEIVKIFPHNPESFVQGLEWQDGKLYEGTGLNGKSSVMNVNPQSGESLVKENLNQIYFGEGITIIGNRLYQLTWQNRKGFVYSLPDLKLLEEFGYNTDGWGLTHFDGKLAMTDGTNQMYFLDPESFRYNGRLEVWDNRNPVSELNELEYVNGSVFANKYQTDTIVEIDPKTGAVKAYLDLSNILNERDKIGNEDVLNGIAYNKKENLFYVTGKNWPKMFAIRLILSSKAGI